MQFDHPDIAVEYERWRQKVGPELYDTRRGVGIHDALRAHFLIVDFFVDSERGIGGVGPRDLNLLHSAVSRQFVAIGLTEKWPEPMQKVATLLFGLVKDHPFHDANKRTAFLVTLYQLAKLGRTPTVSQKEFEDFFVEVADDRLEHYARFQALLKKGDDPVVLFVEDFLRRNTREIDKRPYTVTYRQLNGILRQHGFELTNPSGNYIDLVRVEHNKGLFGLRTMPIRREIRLTQVGFPGWKRQIGRGALKEIREAAGLTAERGCDSAVFFQGADSLTALIEAYEAPLRRLANR